MISIIAIMKDGPLPSPLPKQMVRAISLFLTFRFSVGRWRHFEEGNQEYVSIWSDGFMGLGKNKVFFVGHGIGLNIDEYPVLAKGFDLPIEEGMAIAVEPKIGIPGFGMVGVENTFEVTAVGGKCLTGDTFDIFSVEDVYRNEPNRCLKGLFARTGRLVMKVERTILKVLLVFKLGAAWQISRATDGNSQVVRSLLFSDSKSFSLRPWQ